MLACAQDEVGVEELTGHNDGQRVEEYLAFVGLLKGQPWCAASVSFIYSLCGIANPRSGYCPSWFPESKVVYRRGSQNKNDFDAVQEADAFGIWFESKGRIAHMGIIEKKGLLSVTTLEGNTSDASIREGDGYRRKYRQKNMIYAVVNYID